MPLNSGQILNNRYRIVKLLKQGGFGTVYRAWDINFDLPCALKENTESSEEAQRQFTREARLLHTLRHPNLPLVKDIFSIPGQGQYLVMDFIEGEDLQSMLERSGRPLSEMLVLDWISQVCDALTYMHAQNPPVIHRDIKPANIKITPEGKAMLVDFGIAKTYDPNTKTTIGARAVTPGYSPFEQYGNAPTDARTDIYALGATTYTLLTGQEPTESIARVAGMELPAPRSIKTSISVQIESAILKAMEVMPANRCQEIAAFKHSISKPYMDSKQQATKYVTPIGVQIPSVSANLASFNALLSANPAMSLVSSPNQPFRWPFEPEVICIPAGKFTMGSNDYPDESPVHDVYLDEYYIGHYPVTNKEYLSFIQATGYKHPSDWSKGNFPRPKRPDRYPIVNISWFDAQAYCEWLTQQTGHKYRLPSEAEWEKAARGTDGRVYPWGNMWETNFCNSIENDIKEITQVGNYSPQGDSPYHVADMAGNIWEWIHDWFSRDYYHKSPTTNPQGPPSGEERIIRGAAWNCRQFVFRSACRERKKPSTTLPTIGFRMAYSK